MGMGISLCMIVKDEAQHLERCLNAVRDVVDEIIVVDTGSTDDTPDIARRYGAIVMHATWSGDFARARNQSLALATNPWILVLDADEVWLPTESMRAELGRLVSSDQDEIWGYWIQVTSLLGHSGEERVTDVVCRLFRNDPRIAFKGTIHEEVASSIYAFAPQGIAACELEILHDGYLDRVITSKNKIERNMRLIRSALNQTPDQPELLYALAAEWFQQGNYEEALRLLVPLLAELEPGCGYYSDLVLKTAYAWREYGHPERALAIVQAWAPVYEDFPDLLELGAVLQLDLGHEEDALEWLRHAKSVAGSGSKYTSVSGAGSYRSLILEGMAFEQLGQWQQAEEAYTAAIATKSDSVAAWQRLLWLAAVTERPNAVARVVARHHLPLVAWQVMLQTALDAHRPEWLLRHAGSLAGVMQAQPLASGLARAQLGEDAVAEVALRPWASHAQYGPAATLALWALACKRRGLPAAASGESAREAGDAASVVACDAGDVGDVGAVACKVGESGESAGDVAGKVGDAGDVGTVGTVGAVAGEATGGARAAGLAQRHAAAAPWPAAAGAAEALLREPAPRGDGGDQAPAAASPAQAPQAAVHAAADALARTGAWPAWLRLLAALPPGAAPALLAALAPAARCGVLRAPASVREGLLQLCGGDPPAAGQPFADEVPAAIRTAEALVAGTLALLAGRRHAARAWAELAQRSSLQATAAGRPATTVTPGVRALLRLTAPGATSADSYAAQCQLLWVHL
ncbi:tetratricopeptide (TPR) repeat protein [Paenibacillus amylolyticus]|uniref:Tetratricopeptide (TPR) repeat protein n=1 Tax=Paenibacillus amylolyticus TaxID=1451 RepID=A0AAP5LL50_PAEAM|nr:glycosyltransferase [Paenibacillus amylolyticus]MDR6723007.1 tetratricopeptide (TPR) repeat protein [Paenibacillus amylolyticus]